ncbi:MAG TPA: hypothetical protein DEQ34_08995 [Balneolaceae bacterium]|nr:hypothetical protein [Balneolaceae bacterium]|tara:strand:+ start:200711 stop:201724 length:1014 start_codon:yes stop_codon:yes gene_type:complete
MSASIKEKILLSFKRMFKLGIPPGTNENDLRAARRERIFVFVIAYIMALSMWFVVNLNSDYNITVDIPVEAGAIPDDMALINTLPDEVQADISGNGWKLVNLYNNPPSVLIDLNEGEVNLFDQVRQRFSVEQDVSVLKVSPFMVTVALEKKVSKKVPITLHTDIEYMNRYGLVGDLSIYPDSITVTGAESQISEIRNWVIEDTLKMRNVREDIDLMIPIRTSSELITTSIDQVEVKAKVSEFTEGELTVYIKTRNLPRGQVINYNPSAVSIRYDVPIDFYTEVQKMRPYEVYVPYSEILEDSTGFVTPDIELKATDYEIRLRSFQPKAVAYFSVLDQ